MDKIERRCTTVLLLKAFLLFEIVSLWALFILGFGFQNEAYWQISNGLSNLALTYLYLVVRRDWSQKKK